jgi:hypothetical protein
MAKQIKVLVRFVRTYKEVVNWVLTLATACLTIYLKIHGCG